MIAKNDFYAGYPCNEYGKIIDDFGLLLRTGDLKSMTVIKKDVDRMKALADTIYNNLLDMDYMDNEEAKEQEVENLLHDLELLNKHGNGTLLKAIEMMMEN